MNVNAALLKRARELSGVTQGELSVAMGMDHSDVSRFEKSGMRISEKRVASMARFLKAKCRARREELEEVEGRLG